MCKEAVISELSQIFGCTQEQVWKGGKTLLKISAIYIAVMFITFILAAVCAGIGGGFGYILGAVFSFLLMFEIGLLSTAVTIMIILAVVYYGGYFAAKGWKRS